MSYLDFQMDRSLYLINLYNREYRNCSFGHRSMSAGTAIFLIRQRNEYWGQAQLDLRRLLANPNANRSDVYKARTIFERYCWLDEQMYANQWLTASV